MTKKPTKKELAELSLRGEEFRRLVQEAEKKTLMTVAPIMEYTREGITLKLEIRPIKQNDQETR